MHFFLNIYFNLFTELAIFYSFTKFIYPSFNIYTIFAYSPSLNKYEFFTYTFS